MSYYERNCKTYSQPRHILSGIKEFSELDRSARVQEEVRGGKGLKTVLEWEEPLGLL